MGSRSRSVSSGGGVIFQARAAFLTADRVWIRRLDVGGLDITCRNVDVDVDVGVEVLGD